MVHQFMVASNPKVGGGGLVGGFDGGADGGGAGVDTRADILDGTLGGSTTADVKAMSATRARQPHRQWSAAARQVGLSPPPLLHPL